MCPNQKKSVSLKIFMFKMIKKSQQQNFANFSSAMANVGSKKAFSAKVKGVALQISPQTPIPISPS